MLVMSRKRGQTIVVGGSITIEVVGIQGNKVRIGVRADGMTVHRGEIQAKINQQGEDHKKGKREKLESL